jgi:uncharacterized membrane protein YdfJ with MMPL/SSD domain
VFAAWGRIVHRRRGLVLAGSTALLALSVLAILNGGLLSSSFGYGDRLPAQRAADLVAREIGGRQPQGGSSLLLMLRNSSMTATDPAFQAAVDRAVRPLRDDSRVTGVVTPFEVPAGARSALVSTDGHAVLVQVSLRDGESKAARYYPELRDRVRGAEPSLRVEATGTVPIQSGFQATLESDLRRAEMISLPITLLLLVAIFGTVMAAGLPLGVGLLTIAGGIGGTLLMSHLTDVSQYALNIVTLIGLGVSIDYSLFIVTRHREELRAGATPEEALATTMTTAGRAVAFSGATVAIGLGALLFFPGSYLFSMGEAGMLVVAVAVLYGLTFLPSVLALLGHRVEWLRAPFLRGQPASGLWRGVAAGVMRRPLLVLLPTLAALLLAGTPFLHIRLANGDVHQLPAGSAAREGYETLVRDFPSQADTRFSVVARYPDGDPLAAARVGQLYDLSRRVASIPGVRRVDGPFSLDPRMGRAAYVQLYSQPRAQLPPEVRQVVKGSVGGHVVVLTAVSGDPARSDGARAIVSAIRQQSVPGAELLVGGVTASDQDMVDFVLRHLAAAIGFVVGVTLVILFLLTGSVLLPIKAVLTNLVSIAASFGALVFIFQDGHLSGLLGFTPQPIDPSIPVLLFATVFGLSMDYEVMLLTRIQERYRATGANAHAVLTGLARSGGLITGAAAIMVAVFAAFATSQVLLIKSIGLGLAIAVVVDATLIRGLIVPSVMRLLGDANWWAPGPLRRLHDRIGIAERSAARPEREAA